MINCLDKSEIEQIALNILREENGYSVLYGPDISEGANKEREYTEVALAGRLRAAIDRLNPDILPMPAKRPANVPCELPSPPSSTTTRPSTVC